MPTIKEQFDRIYEVVGCNTNLRLAEILGITQASVTDAYRRKEIPQAWLLQLSLKWGVAPEWILNGGEVMQNKACKVVTESGTPAVQEKTCNHCDDPLLFAMKDNYHEFSMGLFTVLQCLKLAETEGHVPLLPDDWWIQLAIRYDLNL